MCASSCTQKGGGWLSCPCYLVWGATALFALLSWHAYVCDIRGACGLRTPRTVATHTLDVRTHTAPQVTDAVRIWSDMSARPVVLHFKPNSDAVVEDDASAMLTSVVEYMKANGEAQLLLTGHTNAHTSQAYTNKLGLDRAAAVRAMLVAMGAPQEQIFIESKGQTELVSTPATAEGRYLNRRVVVSVIK